jgi:hypothetical protein
MLNIKLRCPETNKYRTELSCKKWPSRNDESSSSSVALQPLVGFGLLYDFVPQSSIFTLLSPVFHFHLL